MNHVRATALAAAVLLGGCGAGGGDDRRTAPADTRSVSALEDECHRTDTALRRLGTPFSRRDVRSTVKRAARVLRRSRERVVRLDEPAAAGFLDDAIEALESMERAAAQRDDRGLYRGAAAVDRAGDRLARWGRDREAVVCATLGHRRATDALRGAVYVARMEEIRDDTFDTLRREFAVQPTSNAQLIAEYRAGLEAWEAALRRARAIPPPKALQFEARGFLRALRRSVTAARRLVEIATAPAPDGVAINRAVDRATRTDRRVPAAFDRLDAAL